MMFTRHWWVAAGVLLLAADVTLAQTKLEPVPAPQQRAARPKVDPDSKARIAVQPSVFDFGEVWEGADAKGEFTIRNTGTEPLEIVAKSSCGCTVPSAPKSPLPPGESTKITISYATSHVGPANKKVMLESNDPTNPLVVIPVKGHVKRLFKATPTSRIYFRDLSPDEVASQSIVMENQYDEPIKLRVADDQDTGYFDVKVKELEPGQKYEVIATTQPPISPGRKFSSVKLATGVEQAPTITVQLAAAIPPAVYLNPRRLFVPPTQVEPTPRVVQVRYRKDTPVKIEQVVVAGDAIQCKLLETLAPTGKATMGMHKLEVMLPAYEDVPATGTRVEIHTDAASPFYRKLDLDIFRHRMPTRRTAAQKPPSARNDADPASIKQRIDEAIREHDAETEADEPDGGGED